MKFLGEKVVRVAACFQDHVCGVRHQAMPGGRRRRVPSCPHGSSATGPTPAPRVGDLRPWLPGRESQQTHGVRTVPTIKPQGRSRIPANLVDYEAERARFSWAVARRELDGLPNGGLNIAYECVDRHARSHRRDQRAIRWLGKHGEVRDFTYADLSVRTNRFAGLLDGLGVRRGERVFMLTDRVPELYISVLGTLKLGAVACTLFSAFGPEPIRDRLRIGSGRVLVTTERLYRRKVEALRDELPDLEHVVLIGAKGEPTDVPGTVDYSTLMDEADDDLRGRATDARRHGTAALHQRHDRYTQGCGPRARGGTCPSRDRPDGAGSPRRRRLLVHRGPRLGDGHVVRDRRLPSRTG